MHQQRRLLCSMLQLNHCKYYRQSISQRSLLSSTYSLFSESLTFLSYQWDRKGTCAQPSRYPTSLIDMKKKGKCLICFQEYVKIFKGKIKGVVLLFFPHNQTGERDVGGDCMVALGEKTQRSLHREHYNSVFYCHNGNFSEKVIS